jgi:hypothetical protein
LVSGSDRWIWSYNSTGEFSVNTAYRMKIKHVSL